MRTTSFEDLTCPLSGAIEQIGNNWGLLNIRNISFADASFAELRRDLSISTATLLTRLRHLRRYAMIERANSSPTRARPYRLTAKGDELWKVSLALREWGERWPTSADARQTLLVADAPSRGPVHRFFITRRMNAVVPFEHLDTRAGPRADEFTLKLLARRRTQRRARTQTSVQPEGSSR